MPRNFETPARPPQVIESRALALGQLFAHTNRGATLNVRRAHRALQAARQGRSFEAAQLLHVELIYQGSQRLDNDLRRLLEQVTRGCAQCPVGT
jgi:hypothetical protein